MKPMIRLLAATMLVLASGAAQAAITCSISSGGFSTGYDPAAAGINVTPAMFTVTCTRGSAGDPTTVNYSVGVDDGNNGNNSQNTAAFGGGQTINYELYRDAACGSIWQGASKITGTITFVSTGTLTQQKSYWGCVPAGQSPAAGTYTDMVTMTMTYGAPASTAVGTAGVTIITPATCSLTTPPANVVFTYVSFGAVANASSNFAVKCSLALPYSMALDATSGTVVGLNYTLALSAASSVGTGVAKTHTINGSIAAAQAGTCTLGTCSGTQARSLTITY